MLISSLALSVVNPGVVSELKFRKKTVFLKLAKEVYVSIIFNTASLSCKHQHLVCHSFA